MNAQTTQPVPPIARHIHARGLRVVLITGHLPLQKRKASMQWFCEDVQKRGGHVTMVSVGYSWLSRWRKDRRLMQVDGRVPEGYRRLSPSFDAYFGYAPIHPFSLRQPLLDALMAPAMALFRGYWAKRLPALLAKADLVLIESGPPILLADIAKKHAPHAKFVYRASDDCKSLGLPRTVLQAELEKAPLFDRISMAGPQIAARFHDFAQTRIDPIGVPRAVLEQPMASPFTGQRGCQAVCAGTTQIDLASASLMAEARPDWTFHILGRIARKPDDLPTNLVLHGEVSYETSVSYIRYADIGLALYRDLPGIEYQAHHSNRMLLYRYFGLPILGPHRVFSGISLRGAGYEANDAASIRHALDRIATLERGPGDPDIEDWSRLTDRLLSVLPGVHCQVESRRPA
ncbi:hypothetical protein RPE78_15395 (plasmid) [Thioclava litoralis]|uniref:Glucuronosyltransferase GumK N-terminal domain-containing protein n=1 Tax=Thioclava litoralis TaxID=3076557 RepID=A0ABZ1E2C7_9RHOB|nr:hypothetical protein RPE78_15395 [Thioclava sp. FTW29]